MQGDAVSSRFCLHFRAIFRRLAGFERPESSPLESMDASLDALRALQQERVGRPRRQVKGNQHRNAGKDAVTATEFPANCVSGILETHSNLPVISYLFSLDVFAPTVAAWRPS